MSTAGRVQHGTAHHSTAQHARLAMRAKPAGCSCSGLGAAVHVCTGGLACTDVRDGRRVGTAVSTPLPCLLAFYSPFNRPGALTQTGVRRANHGCHARLPSAHSANSGGLSSRHPSSSAGTPLAVECRPKGSGSFNSATLGVDAKAFTISFKARGGCRAMLWSCVDLASSAMCMSPRLARLACCAGTATAGSAPCR